MPDFGPYLIFCLYLSRMQKYAFFSVSPNIPGKSFSRPPFFLIKNTGNRGNKKQPTEEKPKKSSIFALAYLKDR